MTRPDRTGFRHSLVVVLCLALWGGTAWAETAGREAAGHGGHDSHQAAVTHGGHDGGSGDVALVRGGITREEERAYSLFMHRTCGIAVISLGVLILADRLTRRRYGFIRKGMGFIWLLMGVHIFFNADPTDWPVAASFTEGYSRAGSGEWMQHKLLSLVPMAIGLYTMFSAPKLQSNPVVSYGLAGVLAVAGLGLLFHEHEHSPGMDMALIVKQHNVMAVTALLIAAGWLADALDRLAWKPKLFVVPVGLILLGLELALYTE
jgi:hypothetical protein